MDTQRRHLDIPWKLIVVFLLMAVGIAVAGMAYFQFLREQIKQQEGKKLDIVAKLKVDAITDWRGERLADASTILENHILAQRFQQLLANPASAPIREEILTWLAHLLGSHQYKSLFFLDPAGKVQFSVHLEDGEISQSTLRFSTEVIREKKLRFSDFYVVKENNIVLDLFVPVVVSRGKETLCVGSFVLRINPREFLFPLIQSWPVPSRTSESLLIRREGDDVLYLNDLRHRKNAALAFRLPMTDEKLPAAMAAAGGEGVVEGVDYRHTPVLAAVRQIPDSTWILIAKVDKDEIFAPVRERALQVTVLVSALILLIGLALGILWHRQQVEFFKKEYESALEHEALAKHYEVLAKYASDILILFDPEGKIIEVNDRAVEAYGYSREELLLLNMRDLRPLESRDEFETRLQQTRERGHLLFTEIHQRKDKSRFPVEISGQYFTIEEKGFFQAVIRDISERYQAEKVLRESESKYRELVEHSPDAIFIADQMLQILLVNQRACDMLGYSEGELLSLKITDTYPEEEAELSIQRVRELPALGALQFERGMRRKDGTTFPVEVSLKLLKSGTCLGIVHDITKRKNAEVEIRTSEEKYRTLAESAQDSIFILNREGRFEYVNSYAAASLGRTQAELMERTLSDSYPLEVSSRQLQNLNQVFLTGEPLSLEEQWRFEGSSRWTSTRLTPIRNQKGEISAVLGISRDISEQKRTEQERQVIFEIIEGINHTGHLGELLHLIHQSLRKVIYAENFFIALYNKRTELFEFPYFVDQLDPPPDPMKASRSRTAYVFRTGRPILMTDPVFRELLQRDEVELVGSPPPVWLGVPLRTGEETIGVLVVQHYSDPRAYAHRDLEFLTSVGNQVALAIERKRAEEEVLLQRARFQSLFENAPVGIVMLDGQDRILRTNRAFDKLFDSSIHEVQGKLINEVIAPADLRAESEDMSRKTQSGIAVEKETVRQRRDGTRVPVHAFGIPFFIEGKQMGIFAMYADLTESKLLADQLRQSQKMEAIGRLAGGVAHDFNNLLTAIIGYGQLVLGRMGEHNPLNRHVEEIIKAGERAAGLTSQLLAFSRKQILQPIVLNLNSVVSDMDRMLRRLIGEDVELITHLDPSIGCVRADPSQMSQVIMNLAVNSRDAMPRGGKLIIETGNADLDEAYAGQHAGLVQGPYVMLAITDTGIGMDPKTMSHVFEPFFTTKGQGKGTGLGLSTVYGIVKQSEGYVYAYSEVGRGTTFKIYLPRVPVEIGAEQERRGKIDHLPGTETILVVEDEDGVRSLIQETLQLQGYKILPASDGLEALKLNESYQGTIDLMLTDIIMPQMNGRELAEKLCPLRPAMRVLYMSGYANEAVVQTGTLQSNIDYIQKPFSPATLAHRVRAVLDKISMNRVYK